MIAGAAPTATEQLGDARYLASDFQTAAPIAAPAAQPHSVQVVETAAAAPPVVSTVASVTKGARPRREPRSCWDRRASPWCASWLRGARTSSSP
jgi:hypothetical protein